MVDFHRTSSRSFPWRQSENLYEVLIGEVLLQRTRGEQVVAVYQEFLRRWPDREKLSRARVSTVKRVIRPLGLGKRASILKQLGIALVGRAAIPTDPAQLVELPGIGPYGAHATPCFALGRDLPVVDWVIARVLRRYFGMSADKRPNADKELWELAELLADRGSARQLWLGVLDFAAAVCKPVPLCESCVLSEKCERAQSPIHANR